MVSLDRVDALSGRGALGLYGLATFLSAFLIFSIQPMFTKVVLPVLGGTPAVWSVAMVVFQGLLLGGYLYAHLLIRAFSLKISVLIHVAVTIVALITLPFAIAPDWGDPPASDPGLWLAGKFVLAVGLPFFALSANAPLLQAWLAKSNLRINAYRLYAVSNAGSFAALFAYPFAIEPFAALDLQSEAWRSGFGAFCVLLIACGFFAIRGASADAVRPWRAAGQFVQWRWVALAAIPSALLVASTAYLQTDTSAVPLFWVLPLAIFLLTFIIAFRDDVPLAGWWPRLMRGTVAVALVVLALQINQFLMVLAVSLLTILTVAMVCHAELYRLRPGEDQLTGFYLSISFGGFVGGVFAALLAPHIFSWTAEFPLLLVFSYFVIAPKLDVSQRPTAFKAALTMAALVIALIVGEYDARQTMFFLLFIASISTMFLFSRLHPASSGVLAVMAITLFFLPASNDEQRGFFGVLRIEADDGYRFMKHGTTIHCAQALTGDTLEPLSYYTRVGPIANAIEIMRATCAPEVRPQLGIVGLGVGAMSCLAQKQEQWTFFEIDPLVISVAKDPKRFTYLAECGPAMPIVLGDARQTLAREKAGRFDYLLIDAFSSDAIPAHLLTVEAVGMYLERLKADGVLVFHISNRYLDLTPILAQVAAQKGETLFLKIGDHVPDKMQHGSKVVMIAKQSVTRDVARQQGWQEVLAPKGQALWSDRFTNVAGAIVRSYFSP